jgi:hypothetical protein
MNKNNSLRFNKMVNNFLDELQTILPNEKDIMIFKSQLDIASMVNPHKLLQSFISYVYPYKKYIMEKKEEFFLGDNISLEKDYMSDAIHLTDLWKNKLSEENKEVVWKYFQVMIILSEKSM